MRSRPPTRASQSGINLSVNINTINNAPLGTTPLTKQKQTPPSQSLEVQPSSSFMSTSAVPAPKLIRKRGRPRNISTTTTPTRTPTKIHTRTRQAPAHLHASTSIRSNEQQHDGEDMMWPTTTGDGEDEDESERTPKKRRRNKSVKVADKNQTSTLTPTLRLRSNRIVKRSGNRQQRSKLERDTTNIPETPPSTPLSSSSSPSSVSSSDSARDYDVLVLPPPVTAVPSMQSVVPTRLRTVAPSAMVNQKIKTDSTNLHELSDKRPRRVTRIAPSRNDGGLLKTTIKSKGRRGHMEREEAQASIQRTPSRALSPLRENIHGSKNSSLKANNKTKNDANKLQTSASTCSIHSSTPLQMSKQLSPSMFPSVFPQTLQINDRIPMILDIKTKRCANSKVKSPIAPNYLVSSSIAPFSLMDSDEDDGIVENKGQTKTGSRCKMQPSTPPPLPPRSLSLLTRAGSNSSNNNGLSTEIRRANRTQPHAQFPYPPPPQPPFIWSPLLTKHNKSLKIISAKQPRMQDSFVTLNVPTIPLPPPIPLSSSFPNSNNAIRMKTRTIQEKKQSSTATPLSLISPPPMPQLERPLPTKIGKNNITMKMNSIIETESKPEVRSTGVKKLRTIESACRARVSSASSMPFSCRLLSHKSSNQTRDVCDIPNMTDPMNKPRSPPIPSPSKIGVTTNILSPKPRPSSHSLMLSLKPMMSPSPKPEPRALVSSRPSTVSSPSSGPRAQSDPAQGAQQSHARDRESTVERTVLTFSVGTTGMRLMSRAKDSVHELGAAICNRYLRADAVRYIWHVTDVRGGRTFASYASWMDSNNELNEIDPTQFNLSCLTNEVGAMFQLRYYGGDNMVSVMFELVAVEEELEIGLSNVFRNGSTTSTRNRAKKIERQVKDSCEKQAIVTPVQCKLLNQCISELNNVATITVNDELDSLNTDVFSNLNHFLFNHNREKTSDRHVPSIMLFDASFIKHKTKRRRNKKNRIQAQAYIEGYTANGMLQVAWAPERFDSFDDLLLALDDACVRYDTVRQQYFKSWMANVILPALPSELIDVTDEEADRNDGVMNTYRATSQRSQKDRLKKMFPNCARHAGYDTDADVNGGKKTGKGKNGCSSGRGRGWIVYDQHVLRVCTHVGDDECGDKSMGNSNERGEDDGCVHHVMEYNEKVADIFQVKKWYLSSCASSPLSKRVIVKEVERKLTSFVELLAIAEHLLTRP